MLLICKQCGSNIQIASSQRQRKYCVGCYRIREQEINRLRLQRYTPLRRRAYAALATALLNGSLQRKPCEVCGSSLSQAHHDDYADPLNVRWLCGSHHKQHHHRFGPAKNAYVSQEIA